MRAKRPHKAQRHQWEMGQCRLCRETYTYRAEIEQPCPVAVQLTEALALLFSAIETLLSSKSSVTSRRSATGGPHRNVRVKNSSRSASKRITKRS